MEKRKMRAKRAVVVFLELPRLRDCRSAAHSLSRVDTRCCSLVFSCNENKDKSTLVKHDLKSSTIFRKCASDASELMICSQSRNMCSLC